MELKEFAKSFTFLKPEDVKENPEMVFVITGEGEFRTSEIYGSEQFIIEGEVGEEKKLFGFNKTNLNFLIKETGTSESKNWIGKKMYFEIVKTNVSGKIRDAISIKKVE